MPFIRREAMTGTSSGPNDLATALAAELRNHGSSGQPLIIENMFPTGKVRVVVLWDRWYRWSLQDRTDVIFQAYESVEGSGARDRIALATGLTYPEAHAAGMLPYEVLAAVRKDDPVSLEQCHQAMVQQGASILLDRTRPRLWYSTVAEAEDATRRLTLALPGSDQVWVVNQELDRVENWEPI